jgi:hypothetical protein
MSASVPTCSEVIMVGEIDREVYSSVSIAPSRWSCRSPFGRSSIVSVIAVAVFGLGCLSSGVLVAQAAEKKQVPETGEPRQEGRWEVTPLGRSQHRLYYPHFAAQHRLLLAIDSKPAQLWDTRTGKRVAILSDQKAGVGSCAISPDGIVLLTADRLGGGATPAMRTRRTQKWSAASGFGS